MPISVSSNVNTTQAYIPVVANPEKLTGVDFVVADAAALAALNTQCLAIGQIVRLASDDSRQKWNGAAFVTQSALVTAATVASTIDAQKNVPNGVLGLDANGNASANIIPRTNTLAQLLSMANGAGEIAVATDAECLVMIDEVPHVFTPMKIGAWDDATNTLKVTTVTEVGSSGVNIQAVAGSVTVEAATAVSLRTADVEPEAGNPGSILIQSGFNGSVRGSGDISITAGGSDAITSPVGGSLYLTSGTAAEGVAGDINMIIGSGLTNGSVVGEGSEELLRATDNKLGFNGAAPVTKPVVAGSRGGNAALNSLLVALDSLGLITNSTTA